MERPDDAMTTGTGAGDVTRRSEPGEDTGTEASVAELKIEISETQGELQQTLSEIQERLSPAHIAEQAKNTVRDATARRVSDMAERAGETASMVADQTRRAAGRLPAPVRNNPLPFALIGIGVVWLLMRSRTQDDGDWTADEDWNRDDEYDEYGTSDARSRRYGARYSGYEQYSDRSRGRTGADVSERLGDMASTVGQRVREAGRGTQNRLSRSMRDNPLALGAVALAAGALIGTMMPRTEVEDTYLGDARDSLVDSAREMAEEHVQQLSGSGGASANQQSQGRDASAGV